MSNSRTLLVSVNSSDRTSGTSNDFVINFSNDRFALRPKTVRIVSAGIVYSWFNMVTGVNTRLDFTRAGNDFTVFVPAGNYTGGSLATAVQSAMNAADPGFNYVVSFSSTSVTFTFAGDAPFQLVFSGASNPMAKRLGFQQDTIVPTVADTVFGSTGVANMLNDSAINIHSSLVGGIDNGILRMSSAPATSDEILGYIYIEGSYGNTLAYKNYIDSDTVLNVSQSNLSAAPKNTAVPIRFYLSFPGGFPLDLNGTDWSMVLQFTF